MNQNYCSAQESSAALAEMRSCWHMQSGLMVSQETVVCVLQGAAATGDWVLGSWLLLCACAMR